MDIRNMRQLLAVRNHGSFAKAAQVLGMSQPSLSTAISRMEDQLKVKLFERTSSGSELTPIGELIAERAAKVVAEAQQMMRDAELVTGGEAGEVRIGIGTALRKIFMPQFVRALATRYAALRITFEILDRDRLLPLVKARELDLAICVCGDDFEEEGLLVTRLFTSNGVAVAHPDHDLVGHGPVPLARFAEYVAGGAKLPDYTNPEVLGLVGEVERLLRYQSNDYDALLELALGGHATLLAPTFVAQPYLDAGQLRLVELEWQYKVSFAAFTTRAASYSPIVNRIIAEAVAIGQALQVRPEMGPGRDASTPPVGSRPISEDAPRLRPVRA